MRYDHLVHLAARAAAWAYAHLALRTSIHWEAPLPEAPYLLAVNHPTSSDPFLVLAALGVRARCLLQGNLFDLPVLGHYLRAVGHVPVVEGEGRRAFDQALARLRGGDSVAIFPEGCLSTSGSLQRLRSGAARLALSAQVPVVPIGVWPGREGIHCVAHRVGEKIEHARWCLGGAYALTVGAPLWLTGDTDDRDAVAVASGQIGRALERLAGVSAARVEHQPRRIPWLRLREAAQDILLPFTPERVGSP